MSNDSIPDDWEIPATGYDLRWWLDLAPTLRWTWADLRRLRASLVT